jgi:tetratricopeptide (TPR) repeat protein
MAIDWDRIAELQEDAESECKRGDRLRREGDKTNAASAFKVAEAQLRECLGLLEGAETAETAAARAETLGSLAGMLRRMNRNEEAFELYSKGGSIERGYNLPSTYNRVNRLKYMLLTGKSNLRGLEPEIRESAKVLNDSVNNPHDQRAADSAWTWADLGDCLALLGDLTAAGRAYATFIKKASLKSPDTTLDVLKSIANALTQNHDPGAQRVNDAVALLQSQLAR